MSKADALQLERQIEEAMVEGFPPRLVEHPFTVEFGWPARLGVGISVFGALSIASVPDCAAKTARVREPITPWSWRSIVDEAFAAGVLPHNAVVISIEQCGPKFPRPPEEIGSLFDLFIRYLEPLHRQ